MILDPNSRTDPNRVMKCIPQIQVIQCMTDIKRIAYLKYAILIGAYGKKRLSKIVTCLRTATRQDEKGIALLI